MKRIFPLVCLLLVLFPPGRLTALDKAQVEVVRGAPRLLIDGKPLRARVFFGIQGSRPLPIEATPQEIAFEFTPTENEPASATMHFRFGSTPGDIYLDDIQVVDQTTGRDVFSPFRFEDGQKGFQRAWNIWPVGAQNTVGTVRVEAGCGRDQSSGLHVALKAPPEGNWPDFHIYHHANLSLLKGHRYRVSFWARAQPGRNLTVAFYRPGPTYVFLGGPPGLFENQIRLAHDAGVDLVSFPVDLPWPRPGQPADWSAPEAQCQAVLEANPAALLLPRISVYVPDWWRTAHAEEMMVWDKKGQQLVDVVVASPRFRREAAERLEALVCHLEKKFGKRILGYHPCGQNTGEWFYQDTWGPGLNGYAPADLRAWRGYLRQRYGTDLALRAAWGDGQAALDKVAVPSPAARRAAPAGVLRDPVTERPLLDFADFQQEAMADCVCQLARVVRTATQGRKLVVFFYGYGFEFGAIALGPATSGHYALRRVLSSPDIDILCSPISYFDRGPGQSGPAMTAAESVALAGKMWLYEDDTRTFLSEKDAGFDRVSTLEQTNAILLRNTAQCALRNFATWWMDLGATGWFNDRRLWAEMTRLKALDEPLLYEPRIFAPEIAAVLDERSMLRVAANGHVVTLPGTYHVRAPLGRLGAPYGQYLLDDVLAGRVRARVYVFLNPWCLSAIQRKQLLEATRGSLRVWCYAPGYHDGDRVSLAAMAELIGFSMRKLSRAVGFAEPTGNGKKLGLQQGFGNKVPIEPLFAPEAQPEETLAVYPDGSPAVALRQTHDGWSMFVGPPGLTSELLRLAARRAGAHLFTQTDCNVYANGPYLVLHASQSGPLKVNTGRSAAVRDLLTGQAVGQGPQLTLPMNKGETRVLWIGTKDEGGLP